MLRFRLLPFLRVCAFIACGFGALMPLTLAQTPMPISGTVASDDGQPISGVKVWGSEVKKCCPVRSDQTTTDENGEFRLENPGAVIHFLKEHFQPKTYVLRAGDTDVHVALSSGSNAIVPVCKEPHKGHKIIGWGKYGVQFEMIGRAKLHRGKLDTDYVRHVLTLPNSKSYLEFWFGVYALELTPFDEQFVNSIDFNQQYMIGENGSAFGENSWGHLKNGGSWRQTAFLGFGGALYRDARPEDARVFDQIIDSVCIAPYPQQPAS